MFTKTRLKIGLLVIGVAIAVAVPVVASAQSDDPEAPKAAEVACDWESSAEEIAEIQAETDELAAFLDEQGIAYEIVEDECGLSWVEWDWDDPAAEEAIDEFFGEFDDWGFGFIEEIDPEQALADIAGLLEGLAAHLDAAGVEHQVRNLPVVTWDMTDEAANDAVAEYFGQAEIPFLEQLPGILDFGFGEFGPHDGWLEFEFPFDGEFPFGGEFPFDGEWFDFGFDGELPFDLPAELVERLNATADELAAFLDERGIAYDVEEGPNGIRMVIPDLDDPAAEEALGEFYEEHGGFFGFGFGGPHGHFGFDGPGPFGGFFEFFEPEGARA